MSTDNPQNSFFVTKIFRRIFLLFAVSISVLVLIYSYATIQMQKEANLEVLHSKASTLASSIALACNDAMLKDDMSFIVEYSMDVATRNKEILKIIITNTSNKNIEVSHKSWKMFTTVSKSMKNLQKSKEFYTIRYNKSLHQEMFYYTYPVKLPGLDWGYIHIIYSLGTYNKSLHTLYQSIAFLLSLLFLMTLFISYIVSREITLPILKLTKSAEDVAAGNLHLRANIQRNDEIGELARNFNSMIDKLEHSHEELEGLVAIRTKELEKLNKELDLKIQKAIMENSRKEQMLIQQSRLAAMGEMIGNIAHQWRQPLNALGLVVQNIYYTYEAEELDKAYLERSMNKSKKLTGVMSKTIDDFRNFFRPDKVQERFEISERITSVVELISASYKNHNIMITMDLDDSLESIGYPNEFSQVILNVLTNAKDALIEHQEKTRKVWIRSFSEKEDVVIEIEDNAGGIDTSIAEKIFDPYFTTKEKNKGTGIGLYMSKMIIENNMNGKIFMYNSVNGAVFKIKIKKFREGIDNDF